ncbi:MAG: arginine N-succinyltransferase [Bdellovibrionales bacterium]|nr:arginine N-succinyltransferase [Bdellovibrionales bacterium]
MILLREARARDLDAFERLGQIPGMLNLSGDRDQISLRLERAEKSFRGKISKKANRKYIFVAEDLETKKVVGTSLIAPQHGTPESPHFYFEVGSEQRFSQTIGTGFIHGTLELKFNTDGPTEIGGLAVDLASRNHPARVGRQISFVRFLFAGIHRTFFKNQVLAELLPPLNKKGQSPLWEAVGRRFTNMDYLEADLLCSKNKEFILSLFPSEKIYTTFLPAEARNAIGKVGKDTEPVFHMLKKIGFRYAHHVDPFDGGPHLIADFDQIAPIQGIRKISLDLKTFDTAGPIVASGLICPQPAARNPQEFRAIHVDLVGSDSSGYRIHALQGGASDLSQVKDQLGLSHGSTVCFMPYYSAS